MGVDVFSSSVAVILFTATESRLASHDTDLNDTMV